MNELKAAWFRWPPRLASAIAFALGTVAAAPAHPAELTLLQTIPLADVRGRIDHFAIDPAGQRLFVAALGNNSVEVIDLRAGRRMARISGLAKPQGVAYVADGDRLFVANGGSGRVDVYSGPALEPVGHVEGLDDADNLRVDAPNHLVWVGYGDGALRALDAGTLASVAEFRLAGHPESFQLGNDGRVYVNVPGARQVALVDRGQGRAIGAWRLSERANFPMALDETGHRLFVVTRQPPTLLVFDTAHGRRLAALPICSDSDDLFVDSADGTIYVVCGGGEIDVVQASAADRLEVRDRLRSAPGARTGLYAQDTKRLYVAVPARAGSQAQLRVYGPR